MIRYIAMTCATLAASSLSVVAQAPDLQTPAPVIYLADNLDEPDQLGWCIDTQGRGFGTDLHAHSCKPQGGDVQFTHETDTGLIRSVAFPDYCMVYAPAQPSPLGLVTCDATQDAQIFIIGDTGTIQLKQDPSLCLAVAETSASAGPFMSRGLDMQPCDGLPAALKTWNILP